MPVIRCRHHMKKLTVSEKLSENSMMCWVLFAFSHAFASSGRISIKYSSKMLMNLLNLTQKSKKNHFFCRDPGSILGSRAVGQSKNECPYPPKISNFRVGCSQFQILELFHEKVISKSYRAFFPLFFSFFSYWQKLGKNNITCYFYLIFSIGLKYGVFRLYC